MNQVIFQLPDLSYTIVLKKEINPSNFSRYKYICSMTFLDSINQPIITLTGNELDFVHLIESLYEFNINIVAMYGNRFHFTPDQYNNFFFLEFYINEKDLYLLDRDDFPAENSLQIYFELFESRYGNITSRLKFQIDYEYDLEDFIFHLYQLIEDIPWIDEITSSSLIEWMIDYDLDSRRYSNKN